jgi:hypothetical protein
MLSQWAFGIYGADLRRKWWLEEVILWWMWFMRVVGDLVVQSSFTPFLAEDVQAVLHLCEPCSLSVDVLSLSFGALHHGLPS